MVDINISITRSAQLNWYNLLRSIGKETEASAFQELVITEGKNTRNVVFVYHVTTVAIGHELLKKFWPLVLG